jgi:hypothetical protein
LNILNQDCRLLLLAQGLSFKAINDRQKLLRAGGGG